MKKHSRNHRKQITKNQKKNKHMKRIELITATLALSLIVVTVQAQIVPRYGEVYEKDTGKMRTKEWIAGEKFFRQDYIHDDGKTTTIIFRADSAKFYHIDMAKKVWVAFSLEQLTKGTLSGLSGLETVSRSSSRKSLGSEVIEGAMCTHYRMSSVTVHKSAAFGEDRGSWDEWIANSDNIWRQRDDDMRPRRYLVHRNIIPGPQPDHLFVIPKDFKGMTVPAGGMLEMFTGKTEGQIKQESDIGNKMQDLQDAFKNLNDPGKTQEEKIQEALKLLEGVNKKNNNN